MSRSMLGVREDQTASSTGSSIMGLSLLLTSSMFWAAELLPQIDKCLNVEAEFKEVPVNSSEGQHFINFKLLTYFYLIIC